MVNVTLKGILGKKLGTDWSLSVSSVFEIFEAVEANSSAVSKNFSDLQKYHYTSIPHNMYRYIRT